MLRANIVKDDSGTYAVFIEQGPSASQMTVAKTMDVIARLPSCDGQAADVVLRIGATRHRKKKSKIHDHQKWLQTKNHPVRRKARGTFF